MVMEKYKVFFSTKSNLIELIVYVCVCVCIY